MTEIEQLIQKNAELEDRLGKLEDLNAIRRIQFSYGYYIDYCHYEDVINLFAEDAEVVSDRARDVFHASHNLELVQWHEEFRERAHVFKLGPGMGVYMPLTCPHMVETSDEPSITISLTYSTDATRRNAMVHVMHDLMHRKGIEPSSVGRHPLLDKLTYVAASTLVAAHGPGSHLPACPSLAHHSAYAIAD